jgi:hypothetical protein
LDVEICRADVEEGFHGVDDGVSKAFKFCVIESSIALREIRRKSALRLGIS